MHRPPSHAAGEDGSEGLQESDSPPADELFAQVYASLKALAHQVRAGRAGETFGTTALVHEAYLKLSGAGIAG